MWMEDSVFTWNTRLRTYVKYKAQYICEIQGSEYMWNTRLRSQVKYKTQNVCEMQDSEYMWNTRLRIYVKYNTQNTRLQDLEIRDSKYMWNNTFVHASTALPSAVARCTCQYFFLAGFLYIYIGLFFVFLLHVCMSLLKLFWCTSAHASAASSSAAARCALARLRSTCRRARAEVRHTCQKRPV